MRRRDRRHFRDAFTLLELLFVLLVISTALALAAPSLGGWRRGQRVRDAGEEFRAVARHGRALAIANSQVHRLYVDPNNGRYWLMAQDGPDFVNLGTGMGRVFSVPEGCRISMVNSTAGASSPVEFVEFYPTGRMQPLASVVIAGDTDETYVLESPSPAEGLITASAGAGQAVPR